MENANENSEWNSTLETMGYVGIDTLQEQIRRKVIKRGYEFNILVVGRSGLGKTTLVNTLFKSNVCPSSTDYVLPPTTKMRTTNHVIEEKGMRLRLTVTDTPGFGDQINNDNCWQPILDYINKQYEKYLTEEQSIIRKKHICDTRIHCCLYFVSPTGHSLKPLDIEVMQRLSSCVNLIPIIAKADTLTLEERAVFKKRIKDALLVNDVNIYPPQVNDEDEDAEFNNKIRDMIPFAVVGSDKQHQVNQKNILGRKTQWGLIEVENRAHCEFADLRDMLIRTHMQDLVETTASVNYENFRRQKLQNGVGPDHESSL